MQKGLIRFLLDPLWGIMGKLSQKTRERIFVLAGLGIFTYFIFYNASAIRWRYLYSFVLCCLFLGIMVLCSLSEGMKPVKFRPFISICWFVMGALMVFSGLRNNVNYLPEAALVVAAFPVLYICWNNMDRTRVFALLLKIIRLSAILFLVLSFLFDEISATRYSGFFRNVNNCANYLSLICVCLVLEIVYWDKPIWKAIGHYLLLGVCGAMLYYTNSRSGQLSVLVALLGGAVVYLLTHDLRTILGCALRLIAALAVTAVMVSTVLFVFQLRQHLPLPYFDNVDAEFYYSDYWEEVFANREKLEQLQQDPTAGTLDMSDLEDPTMPTFFGSEGFDEVREEKNDTEGKTLDKISTGRLSVWKAYIQRLKLFGVKQKEPVNIDVLYGRQINTTHMSILEIAYESGIFAGICYLLVNIASGILAIRFAWINRREKYALMPLMVILTFGIDSVLRTTNISFNYMTTFYYHLMLFPLMACPAEKEKGTQA